ncbi:MAG: SO_0444 family Cu/Zn efflux transporter [Muribaculaceae bacterium]
MNLFDTFIMLLNEMSPYLLLGFFMAGLLHGFVPNRMYAKHLSGNDWRSTVKAALFGIPLPLCSCGVLPTAVSLRNNGASRASATSFLIATPQTGVDSIAATYSLLGLGFAVLRPVAALVTSLLGGRMVAAVEEDNLDGAAQIGACTDGCNTDAVASGFFGKLLDSLKYGFVSMMKSIGKWLVIGLVVAALITVLVPDDFFARYAQNPLLNMFVVLIVSVPMYVCATGSIPIALSLMLKGLSPGAAFVLLMAGPAANFASVLVVRRSFGSKATWAYLASIIGGAVAFGLVIDYVLPAQWFVPSLSGYTVGCEHCVSWFNSVCSIVLLALMVYSAIDTVIKSKSIKINNMTKEYKVKGMMCVHCQANVQKGLSALDGVTHVEVDLAKGIAYVDGDVADDVVVAKIRELGYECVD